MGSASWLLGAALWLISGAVWGQPAPHGADFDASSAPEGSAAPGSGPPPTANEAVEAYPSPNTACYPSCRAGFGCHQGSCVSLCNPACESGYTCTAQGTCEQDVPVPAPVAITTPDASEAAEPWRLRDSYLIIGAENLSTIHSWYAVEMEDGEKVGSNSGTDVGLFYSSDGFPRLSVDFAHVGTVGGTLGFRSWRGKYEADGAYETTPAEYKSWAILAGVRGGGLIGIGTRFGVWLRAGYELTHAWGESTELTNDVLLTTHSFVFDPKFVACPAPHFAVALGPYFSSGVRLISFEGDNLGTDIVVSGGLSLSVYGLVGGSR